MQVIGQALAGPGTHRDHQVDIPGVLQAIDDVALQFVTGIVVPARAVVGIGDELQVVALRLGGEPLP